MPPRHAPRDTPRALLACVRRPAPARAPRLAESRRHVPRHGRVPKVKRPRAPGLRLLHGGCHGKDCARTLGSSKACFFSVGRPRDPQTLSMCVGPGNVRQKMESYRHGSSLTRSRSRRAGGGRDGCGGQCRENASHPTPARSGHAEVDRGDSRVWSDGGRRHGDRAIGRPCGEAAVPLR